MARFIFVTGGVVSSLGKGLSSASLAYLLQSRGFKVRLRKLDPYLNVDPGTMSPFQHGEVFVTDDGAETDLDLGHYERFIDVNMTKNNNATAGQVFSKVLENVSKVYEENREKIISQVSQLKEIFNDFNRKNSVLKQDLEPYAEKIIQYLDDENGGFKGAPKFPQFYVFQTLFYFYTSVSYTHLTLPTKRIV